LAAITDEFSPDPRTALDAMQSIGMTGAELRMLWGRNIMNLSDAEIQQAVEIGKARGIRVLGIASPILKCVLPGGPEVDTRFQQDIFASKHTHEDQPALAKRAFAICHLTGAKIVRVFSYWRTVEPEKCFDAICSALDGLGRQAEKEDVIIGVENEHACNVGTAAESAKVLDAVSHPNVQLVWDPCNGLVAGEEPYPLGYSLLPKGRIAHVHAKDCHMEGHTPVFGPLGTRHVDWKGQIDALLKDGYRGAVSLETHWSGPDGDKFRGSVICGWNMRGLVSA
jgi:sugar phosphate isomerase/epimerase